MVLLVYPNTPVIPRGAAPDLVVATVGGAADEGVVAAALVERVDARAAIVASSAGVVVGGVHGGIGIEHVVAGTAHDGVTALAADDRIVARAPTIRPGDRAQGRVGDLTVAAEEHIAREDAGIDQVAAGVLAEPHIADRWCPRLIKRSCTPCCRLRHRRRSSDRLAIWGSGEPEEWFRCSPSCARRLSPRCRRTGSHGAALDEPRIEQVSCAVLAVYGGAFRRGDRAIVGDEVAAANPHPAAAENPAAGDDATGIDVNFTAFDELADGNLPRTCSH